MCPNLIVECPLLRQTCSLGDFMVYNDVAGRQGSRSIVCACRGGHKCNNLFNKKVVSAKDDDKDVRDDTDDINR